MLSERNYYVAFSTVPGIGPARLKILREYFSSLQAAWMAAKSDWESLGLPTRVLEEFFRQRDKLNVDNYVENLCKRGIKFITIDDIDYPYNLKNIIDPPNVLFIKSQLTTAELRALLRDRVIAVVGTRQMTDYGESVTKKLVTELVQTGFKVISGLALGIDGVAHSTTLKNGGKTIAVLGAGVEVIYPAVHRELYNRIINAGGAIISETAPEKFVARGIFPARNRIISGLAQAVLVTEGAMDSGSLITARLALEQGREVFAVPGPINSRVAEGTNYLLKNGAKLVTSSQDILEELGFGSEGLGLGQKGRKHSNDPREERVLQMLRNGEFGANELAHNLKLNIGELNRLVTGLEIQGLVLVRQDKILPV